MAGGGKDVPDGLAKTAVSEAPARGAPRRGLLTVTSGDEVGRVVPVDSGGAVTFGRSEECTVRIQDAGLSRVHARLMRMGDEYILKDMGSTNGSWVNDERVDFAAQLRDGDRVRLGSAVTMRFSLVDEQEEQALERMYASQQSRLLAELAELAGRDVTLKEDLQQAREFQLRALTEVPTVPGVEIDVVYRPLDLVGGDLYDLVALDDGTLRIFVADSTGHGVKASLTTMLILGELALVKRAALSPADLLAALNNRIVQGYAHLGMRFTAACLDLDLGRGVLRHATAAHPAPWVVRDGVARELDAGGTFIGLQEGSRFPQWEQEIARGDAVLALTDGATEASAGSESFDGRLGSVLERAAGGAVPLAAAVVVELETFAAGRLEDDVTLVAVRWLRAGAA